MRKLNEKKMFCFVLLMIEIDVKDVFFNAPHYRTPVGVGRFYFTKLFRALVYGIVYGNILLWHLVWLV